MIGWSLGLVIMAAITVAFYPTIKDQIGTLFANTPKALQSITGSADDYRTVSGYVGVGVFDLRIPMIALTMAIILGINLSVTEETSGKLYQLLSLPISRSKIVFQKWLAMIGIFFITHLALFLGVLATIKLINESMSPSRLALGTFICFMLTVATGSITLLSGFGSGRRGLTTLLISVYVFGGYLLTSFAAQIEWLRNIEPISLFHYYKASEVIKIGLNWQHTFVLLAISCASVLLASILFDRRDIGTHNG